MYLRIKASFDNNLSLEIIFEISKNLVEGNNRGAGYIKAHNNNRLSNLSLKQATLFS